ncbi:MAG: asparagine synthase (glutamine-hydrolyzing) [Actinomycetota bacterium]|nr:asparagine synthase (glutamine-hydrolyzing) [Actinomycetota bacterium]
MAKQLELLEHRGPDSSGFHARGRGVVGQTRLSIIDLETGDPPITNEDETVGVALNGEIYNYRDLREDLLAGGHRFRTRGDTEVLAHLAEDCSGIDLARAVEGMFAFAVWDDRSETLTLVRDRPGKKPLYYWHGNGMFVFASELKAVLAHPSVPRRLDPDALPAYLTFGYVPTPRTFYEGVYSVPPGHVLVVRPGEEPTLTPYWEVRPAGMDDTRAFEGTLDEAAREARRLLKAAVARRLVADVPLGAFLSGGIDSSAVVGLMTELGHEPVRTFTIGFEDDQGFDERPYARMVAERFGTEHHEHVVHPEAIDLIERLVWLHDQPFGDSSAIPTYLLSEVTRNDVTVALCGDGGDELFAGYERFRAAEALGTYRRIPRAARLAVAKTVHGLPRDTLGGRVGSAQRFVDRAASGLPDAFLSWISYVAPERVGDLASQSNAWAMDHHRSIWDASAGGDVINRLLYLNYRTYLLDDLLVKMDRMGMGHGLEVRGPFLDRELTEFAFTLPGAFKSKRLVLKRVLKQALSGLLPREILHRRKQGFGVPLARWFRSDLNSYVHSMLTGDNARVGEHLDRDAIRSLIAEHESGSRDHQHALWAMLTLEVFLRREAW